MNTQQVADRLVELCRQGQFETAQKELYATDAVSDEMEGTPMQHTEGLDAIVQKGHEFMGMVEQVHGVEVGDPIVAGNAFACTLKMDLTMKGQDRSSMDEVCLYIVKDGKIVSERFAA